MKAVIDTNVLISGVFFGGVPGRLVEEWAESRFESILTPLIFDEYEKVMERMAAKRPGLQFRATLNALLGNATLVPDPAQGGPITVDPDDDKFMLAAKAADAVVVSGDSDLTDQDGWEGVRVLTPRQFLDRIA